MYFEEEVSHTCVACLDECVETMSLKEEGLEDKFLTLFNIKIADFSTFSESICLTCFTKLEDSYLFYEQVKRNVEDILIREKEIADSERDREIFKKENSPDLDFNKDNQNEEIIFIKVENDELGLDEVEVKLKQEETPTKDNISSSSIDNQSSIKKEESDTKQYVCSVCQKTFKSSVYYISHLRSHTGELPHKCEYCNKAFPNRNKLTNHARVHTKEKPFVCNYCGKDFRQNAALHTHLKLHTGKTEKCNLCEKLFCTKGELKLHLDKHFGVKKYLCSECGSAFGQKSHLTDHLKGHSNERPFQCDICQKAFKKAKLLKKHLGIHLGIKKFKCTQCDYACYTNYRIMEHQKLHKR